jgi:hypothetical protein
MQPTLRLLSVFLFTFEIFGFSIAQAQLALAPEKMRPLPSINLNQFVFEQHILSVPEKNPITEDQVLKLSQILSSQFKSTLAILQKPVPGCTSSDLQDYLLALQTAGRFDECSQIALSCEKQSQNSAVFLTAALCESTRYRYSQADHFFTLATQDSFQSLASYPEAVLQRASYSLFGIHETDVDAILAKMPAGSANLWKGVLQRIGEIDATPLTKAAIDRFLASQIQIASGSFKGLLLSMQIQIAGNDYRHADAMSEMISNANQMQNPLLWYISAANLFYYGLDQNFAWSRSLYDAFNSFANPWMWFPVEANTYNYTDIYSSVCAKNLIQENEGPEFYQLKKDLREGTITVVEALSKLDSYKTKWGSRADYLTTYGGLLSVLGRHTEAFDYYWQAHKACAYFNRANWGLTLEKRFFKYAARPDFDVLNAKVDLELNGRTVPNEISTYILNWSSLNADVQKRITFGSRIWLPYMATLQKNDFHTYIKYAFDLLSESPGLSNVHDLRIGGVGYPNDNRLWDDVRGIGGDTVVADLAEVFNGVQGDYNLLGHEMSHQFQFLMEKIYPSGVQCIIDLYAQDQNTANFPDSYASQNKEEFFAQGVTYYLVPTDSPARFGLNRNWVVNHDPALYHFISSIEQAHGDLSQISCRP